MKYTVNNFVPFLKLIDEAVEKKILDTAVVGITEKEGFLLTEAFGKLSNGKKVEEDNIYLIFSVTKPIFALSVMQLWERGKLHPMELVSKYIPEFCPEGGENIKIWNLLTHTSGLDQAEFDKMRYDQANSGKQLQDKLIEFSINSSLHYPVGSCKEYNNLGFCLMAEIVRRISGLEHDRYMEENIFKPLGLKETSFVKYRESPDKIVPMNAEFEMERYMTGKYPFGGLQSTARDLSILQKVLLNEGRIDGDGNRLISPLTLKAMITSQTAGIKPYKEGDFPGEDIGLAWFLPENKKSFIYNKIYGHNGLGNNMFWLYPAQEAAFVLLSNTIADIDLSFIHNAFTACLY